jgi:hypothetical protein
MKKIILLILLLCATISLAQENTDITSKKKDPAEPTATKFTYNENGLSPIQITINLSGFKKDDLREQAKAWLDEKFPDEKDVKVKIDNKSKLRYEASAYNVICFGTGSDYRCEDIDYTLEISFKNNEYKMKVVDMSYTSASSKKDIMFDDSDFHDGKGNLKYDYKKVPDQIEIFLNGLNQSFLNFLNSVESTNEW